MNAPPVAAPRSFPSELRAAEDAVIAARRARTGTDRDVPAVGIALSGGGIRSATFCLGLFQALARHKLIRHIDYLSTVSGGGYFGTFLGAAFARDDGSADRIERELADNQSWSVNWLRENGRFLSPNGAGDNWLTAAVALRNWVSLHVVLLTFALFVFAFGALIRADLCTGRWTADRWNAMEQFFWSHPAGPIWGSPWLILPVIPFTLLMVPTGSVYWLTQLLPLMAGVRRVLGLFRPALRQMANAEFASRAQSALTRTFTLGLVATIVTLGFAAVDSLGQTVYLRWSENGFRFPSEWLAMTATGAGFFGFAGKLVLYVERFLGARRLSIPFNAVALGLAVLWLLLICIALSVVACGFAWSWDIVWNGENFAPMSGNWKLMLVVATSFAASWIFSRSFGFVNLSSLQQMYAARLARAYLGASNPERRRHANHDMTELIPGDDLPLDGYAPHANGGPLHLINVTVNETLSGKTQIERRDRKGLAMAVGPCGLSVGIDSHALWASEPARPSALARLQALWEMRQRPIAPISDANGRSGFHALWSRDTPDRSFQRIEALAIGRWVAISGAAFTTGTGANTAVGLSLLLGLANVRLGYWWDSGIAAGHQRNSARPNFLGLFSRIMSRLLPVQTCLLNEFFARFHGPARRHWYLSDGGHFENTACYELIRRRVPFIICSDAGQDPDYQFGDLANLVRKARTDFGAEIQLVRRASDLATDDPGVRFPMPVLEELVHPSLLDVIGVPADFAPQQDNANPASSRFARRHALLARIHYLDTDTFSWLLLVKPSLMGDETTDVVQYQATHPLFPQEPTTDQYFDEAQWESYRKLGEHIGVELFTPPPPETYTRASWSPSQMRAPVPPDAARRQDAAPRAVPTTDNAVVVTLPAAKT
jgi:hypothetical protein